VTSLRYEDLNDLDDLDQFEPIRSRRPKRQAEPPPPKRLDTRRPAIEEFKCGHCRTFVGPPISGGRHRNHCPLCLYSRHVDRQRPGDRESECRSLMEPIGTYNRRNGEQVIVHQCLGCGVERHCRVAADDHLLTCLRLSLMPQGEKQPVIESVQEEAIA
jgi:hypothetical protein